jgi:kynurenine formamidase
MAGDRLRLRLAVGSAGRSYHGPPSAVQIAGAVRPRSILSARAADHPNGRIRAGSLTLTEGRRYKPRSPTGRRLTTAKEEHMTTGEQTGRKGVPVLGGELLDRRVELVNLTAEIFQGMPCFGLHQRPYIMVNHTHEEAITRLGVSMPFSAHNLLMSEHTGTHTDAIYEYDEEAPTLSDTPLEYYYGDAVCLDVSHVRFPARLEPDVLERALEASGQEIRRGDIVLLHTGTHERLWPQEIYLTEYSGLSEAGARWLAERGVVNIGIDAISIDASDDPDFLAHQVCKEFQIVNTESLTNLSKVAGRRFLFLGLPLAIREGTGSPIRAVALMNV